MSKRRMSLVALRRLGRVASRIGASGPSCTAAVVEEVPEELMVTPSAW